MIYLKPSCLQPWLRPVLPVGAVAIIQEYKARGKLTDAILAVVGLDDGLAIFIYAFAITIAGSLLTHNGFSAANIFLTPLIEIGGPLLLDLTIGMAMAFLFKHLVKREEVLAVALTAILLTAGLANILGVSLILACMALGMTIINIFHHTNQPVFETMRIISLPVYAVFFVLA